MPLEEIIHLKTRVAKLEAFVCNSRLIVIALLPLVNSTLIILVSTLVCERRRSGLQCVVFQVVYYEAVVATPLLSKLPI